MKVVRIPSQAVRERAPLDTTIETPIEGFPGAMFTIRALNGRLKRELKSKGLDADVLVGRAVATRGQDMDEEAAELMAELVVGWTVLVDSEGQEIPYSVENVKMLCTMLQLEELAIPILLKAKRAIQIIAEAEAKNSASS